MSFLEFDDKTGWILIEDLVSAIGSEVVSDHDEISFVPT